MYMIGLSIVSMEMFGCLLSIAQSLNVSCKAFLLSKTTKVGRRGQQRFNVAVRKTVIQLPTVVQRPAIPVAKASSKGRHRWQHQGTSELRNPTKQS